LREKYELELENLTLTAQPFKTLKFFTLAVIQCIKKTLYLLAKGGWVMLFSVAVGTFGIVLMTLGGLQEKDLTLFIISVCNNQLLNWIENEFIWVLSHIPGFASVLPRVIASLHAMKDKYLKAPNPASPNKQGKKWDFSFSSVWNTIVWLMLMNFFVKIVNATAQNHLKKQQDKHISELTEKSTPTDSGVQ
ncbi:hypothetical protein V8G54_016803, partial [Vigna mungo]